MTHCDTIIRCFVFPICFSYHDKWTVFSLLFFCFDRLFSIIFPIILNYDGCWHRGEGCVQTAIFDPCDIGASVYEEGPFTLIHWKTHIQNGKQPDGAFLSYYTH
jgi:hypothetical protein